MSSESFFLASSQTLFRLSNPSGKVITQVTAHTTPIHTIHYSPELNVVATAAIGDRFITIFSTEDNTLTRLGSLTCTHDVRAFIVQEDSLLAITILGTLEIFRSFNVGFEPNKKGGQVKLPNAEIQLITPYSAKIEIQDAIYRGQETMISWVEGAKTGFELINIEKMENKVELNIQTRREDTSQQQVFLITLSD